MRETRSRRGVALLLTLIAIALVATLSAGIGALVLGHLNRASADQDAARALNYAEAALNFQVQRISANATKTQVPYDPALSANTVDTATYGTAAHKLPVGDKTYWRSGSSRKLRDDYLDLGSGDTCEAWVATSLPTEVVSLNLYDNNDQFVYGRATINGVTRTVRARGGGVSALDRWTFFGNSEIDVRGNITLPKTLVGSNGSVLLSGNADAEESKGLKLYGPAATARINGAPFTQTENLSYKINLPGINQIANQHAAYIRSVYTGADAPTYKSSVTTTNGIENFRVSNDNSLATNLPSSGSFIGNSRIVLRGKSYGANYFISGMSGNTNIEILADVREGPVNLWVNKFGGNDAVNGNIEFLVTDNDSRTSATLDTNADLIKAIRLASLFHIYYNNNDPAGKLQVNGNVKLHAMLYAYSDGNTSPGIINVNGNGNLEVEGSLIADQVTVTGNVIRDSRIISILDADLPPSATSPGEGLLGYGIRASWQEWQPLRGN